MQPYSHFIIAGQLEAELRPDVPADYYWGAVAADIRVTAGLPRERTHLSPEKVLEFRAKYPHLRAFIQGYLVHILSDLVEVQALIRQRPLMDFVLRRNGPKFAQNLIEEFYLTQKKQRKPVDIRHNELLNDLGISATTVAREAELMSPYLRDADYKIALTYLKTTGNGANSAKSVREIESLHNSAVIKPALFYLSALDKLNQQVLRQVRAAESFRQMCA